MNNPSNLSFLRTVESVSAQKLTNCYRCQKCTTGCPVAYVSDYTVSQLIRLITMNRADEVLTSSMIWLCTACETCGARCPNDINMAPVMDALKRFALQREGLIIKEERISAFHDAFLSNIRKKGRLHEIGMMAKYKLKTGGLFSEMSLGVEMFKRGKLKLIPHKIKRIKEIRTLFEPEEGRNHEK